MARVRFTGDFDWPVHARSLIAYKAGHELTVKRACADAAIAAGKAEELKAHRREPGSPPADEADDG